MKLLLIIAIILTTLCIIAPGVSVVSAADMPGTPGPGGKTKAPQGADPNQKYTIPQTLSDQAQKATIAFDALTFLTGDACSDTSLPPGKVADHAGFEYLRDSDFLLGVGTYNDADVTAWGWRRRLRGTGCFQAIRILVQKSEFK